MLRVLLIDDEKAALNTLSKKIEMYCEEIEILEKCNSAKEGLVAINKYNPDLVFLDIEMPWMNGFEMLACLGDVINFNLVFVTAYDQYAIQAFKVKAIDYLLKPVDKDDLISCVDNVKSHMKKFDKSSFDALMIEMDRPIQSNRVMIHTTEGIEVLAMEEILYCQASSNYTFLFTNDNRKIVVSKTLAEIEKLLSPKYFLRIHKSYTANLGYVQKYSNIDGGELILKSGQSLPVSRRKKEEVLDAITGLV